MVLRHKEIAACCKLHLSSQTERLVALIGTLREARCTSFSREYCVNQQRHTTGERRSHPALPVTLGSLYSLHDIMIYMISILRISLS